jgi:hypothetical protein
MLVHLHRNAIFLCRTGAAQPRPIGGAAAGTLAAELQMFRRTGGTVYVAVQRFVGHGVKLVELLPAEHPFAAATLGGRKKKAVIVITHGKVS